MNGICLRNRTIHRKMSDKFSTEDKKRLVEHYFKQQLDEFDNHVEEMYQCKECPNNKKGPVVIKQTRSGGNANLFNHIKSKHAADLDGILQRSAQKLVFCGTNTIYLQSYY